MDGEQGTPDAGADQSVEQLLGLGEPSPSATPESAVTPTEATQQGDEKFTFGGRDYKSQDEAEKSYNALLGSFSQGQSKVKVLESILSNPNLASEIQNNPELKEAVAKVGLELASAEAQGNETEGDQGDVDEGGVEYRMARLEYAQQFRDERSSLESELKRPLEEDERKDMVSLMEANSELSLRQAWQLANFEKMQKDSYDRGLKEGRPAGRQRPTGSIPGVKLDTKKDVTDMNRGEYRAHLEETLRKAGDI